jgi:tetratricopeptide (TPR) repeat protein
MQISLTHRLILLLVLWIATCGIAPAQQPDPHGKENAQIKILIQSGNEKARQRDFDGAIADFNEAIAIGKNLPDLLRAGPFVNRGLAYEGKGDYAAALADLNKAIKLNANNSYTYQDRADVYGKLKEWDKALTDYSKVIKLTPKFPYAYRGRGLVLLHEGKDVEAQADFEKYLQLNPSGKDALDKQIEEIKAERAVKQH